MPFALPINHKFACVALENADVDRMLSGPVNLGGGLWILFEPPFPLNHAWHGWIGSIQAQHLERSNLVLFAHNVSATPEVLDAENEALRQQVLCLCYALFLIEVFHYDGGLILSGANVGGTVSVRQVSQLERFYRPNGAKTVRLTHAELLTAARAAAGMQSVHAGHGHHGRLRKGFHAWLRGMMESHGEERLHQFVRAVEAVVMPPKGRSTNIFAHRCQLFAGNTAPAVSLLKELYELRNSAEHHNPFTQVLGAYPTGDHERIALRRAYQAQVLASDVYRRIFLDPQLLAHFSADASISAFWATPWAQQVHAWGAASDLDALATSRMLV